MAEREFSPEDIQMAADEARRGGFGDFMFMDPGSNRGTSRRSTSNRKTSSKRTSSRRTSKQMTSSRHRNTTRRNTSRRRTSRHVQHLECTNWHSTAHNRHQSKSCWKDGNMWVFKKRKKGC
ncbi:CotG/ExsB N-terminal domain-containing protein [Bacillus sp. JJ1764]|uniref:CotG/ExsB N-terminal domain-containing protein n=1 Tax=Bacillus sp. JJ1764 TaxID=3122964 RepID=UPI002FFDAB23